MANLEGIVRTWNDKQTKKSYPVYKKRELWPLTKWTKSEVFQVVCVYGQENKLLNCVRMQFCKKISFLTKKITIYAVT